ncbi:MAG: hypothetical protein U0231_09515 [Nitrospiraceae bacterium]
MNVKDMRVAVVGCWLEAASGLPNYSTARGASCTAVADRKEPQDLTAMLAQLDRARIGVRGSGHRTKRRSTMLNWS